MTPRTPDDVLLTVHQVDASYGPLQVLFGVDLEVRRGDRAALLGTNGAGKSTLLRVVTGLLEADTGRVVFDGADITNWSPRQRVESGIRMVAGGRAAFSSLTVEENLQVGCYPRRRERAWVRSRLDATYDRFVRLRERRNQLAGTLSGGEQQLLAVARALLEQPRLMVIDELSLGLAPLALSDLVHTIDEVLSEEPDITLLVVEQSLNVAAELTHTAHFMEKGQVRFSGSTRELTERGDLARSVFFGDARG